MKKYRLKKDLPTFKAGEEFAIFKNTGDLCRIDGYEDDGEWYTSICAYSARTLKKFPNILTDWFEEIQEQPKTVWDLEEGDGYFYIAWHGHIEKSIWGKYGDDEEARESGNCFFTEKEAEKELARRKVKVILERDTNGFKSNWEDELQDKYHVFWLLHPGRLEVECENNAIEDRIYFATEEDAKASIKAHEKEWKTYLGVEE